MGTLVWGLDKDYLNNKEWIEDKWDVVAYYDSNETKQNKIEGRITKRQLEQQVMDFDNILVCADPPSIVMELVENYKVPLNKIKVVFYELLERKDENITFHGENSEDAVIMLLLNKMGIAMDSVSYLEVGTNDPVRNNNSFSLYEAGARGTLVDAFPMVKELARMIRPDDKFINCAVSNYSGGNVEFFVCESSAFSSLDERHHEQYDNKRPNSVKTITVPVIGINELITMCDSKPNILLCDAEGYDELIVKSIDYKKNDFAIIMLETDHMDSGEESVKNTLEKNGYKLFSRIKQNDIYYNTKYDLK